MSCKSAEAAYGKCKAEPETATLREAGPEPQIWGEDGGETPFRLRSESIWIVWNKGHFMPY
jgi:hypothetical protein